MALFDAYKKPELFHNHGDNPAYKKFIQIQLANHDGGKAIDYRTYVVDKTARFLMARNWQDLLQRDLKATTFPRAAAILVLNTMASYTACVWVRRLLPVGKLGIRSVFQTPFYYNFGALGLVGAGALGSAAVFTEYKTLKFTVHKFYRHVLMGERNWILEGENTSRFGSYEFSDNPIANEDVFSKSELASMLNKKSPPNAKPTYNGPYGEQKA